jgi:N-acetyl-1-D-myo-inositol-2-amino-2-deoxy-alpha-D-glucopyranoside deacetylase
VVGAPRRTLLVALAHPDDETFGTGGLMARAVDEGHRVVIVCATRGEVGEIADPSLATPATLGEVRERELRAAAKALGVEDVRFLGFRDSGMAGTPENADPRALVNAKPDDVIHPLVRVMRDVRPDVVVTFEPGGIYGHPDHVTISERATSAVDAAADAGKWPDAGPAHRVPRLYHVAIPRSVLRRFKAVADAAGVQWGLADAMQIEQAVDDSEIDAALDATPWIDRKKAAVAAHATQLGTMNKMPEGFTDAMFGREWFVLAKGERDGELLAGL